MLPLAGILKWHHAVLHALVPYNTMNSIKNKDLCNISNITYTLLWRCSLSCGLLSPESSFTYNFMYGPTFVGIMSAISKTPSIWHHSKCVTHIFRLIEQICYLPNNQISGLVDMMAPPQTLYCEYDTRVLLSSTDDIILRNVF